MSNVEFGGFVRYRNMIIETTSDLKKIHEYAGYLGLASCASLVEKVLKRVAEDSFDIAIVGEFKRGKSTLINAILGKDVLPTDILPCSATLNRITYSMTPLVKIEYKDGRIEEVDIDKLSEYVTKLTDESEKMSETVKEATVYYPVNYCKNNVDIIDTPGLNDDRNMTEVTLSVLPQVDAAIMVIMATSPFSEYERDFLENKLLTNDLGRVMFVVNRIDSIDEDEVDKLLSSIANRIEKYVLSKAEKTYGKDSDEYAVYRKKIGKPKVYGISAKKALKGKVKGDDQLLADSCFPQFEEALETFLTEDRGAVVLQIPVNRILAASGDILKALELRESAMSMEAEEFEKKYNDAVEELEELRRIKKDELKKVTAAASEAYRDIMPMIDEFWPGIKAEAARVIEEYPVEANDISKANAEATQTRMLNKVTEAAKTFGQSYSEKIQAQIQRSLNVEIERLQGFEDTIYTSLDNIQNSFINIAGTDEKKVKDSAVGSTIINYFTGLGGAFTGYRAAGFKGALVGGLASFGGTMVTSYGVGILIGALGLPLTWPVLIAAGVVAAVTGTFAGNKAILKFLPDRTAKFKEGIRDAIQSQFDELMYKNDFGRNVQRQVNEAFDALKGKIEDETEAMLEDTRSTLDELKENIQREKVMTEKEKDKMKEIAENVVQIMKRAQEVNQQIITVLDK